MLNLLISFSSIKAQDIDAPSFSINGALADILCVNPTFSDSREAIATALTTFPSNTEFILELSDADGDFGDTTVLSTFVKPDATPITGTIEFPEFPIPSTLRGENFSLRVRVESLDITSTVSTGIPIYYFDSSEQFTLTGPNIEANTDNGLR